MKILLKRLLSMALVMMMIVTCLPVMSTSAAYENTYVNTGDQAADILGVAATQIGYLEGSLAGTTAGSNNYTKYGVWYDNYTNQSGFSYGAWCAMFVSWCAYQAGIPSSTMYYHAYCPYGVTWFKDRGLWQYSASRGGSYTPQPGDIIYFAPSGSSTSSHVGIVRYASGGYVYTYEGNTSGQNGEVNEGGGAFAKSYSLSYSRIYGYGTPNYEEGTGTTAEKLGTYRITASSLNVRAGTSTSYDILGVLYTNDIVVVTELSNGWGKVRLEDGTEGWCSISNYGEYIGVDALNTDLTSVWGEEHLAYTTDSNGSVTFTNNSSTDAIAVDMPLPLSIGNKTTPYFNISTTAHSGGYYFGLTQSGTSFFMMRECTSGDELVEATTATYMTSNEDLQIDIGCWWAPEEKYQIDTVRLYLDAGASVTVNYCYFAASANVVSGTAYNTREGGDVGTVEVPDPLNLMLPDTLSIVDTSKTGSYTYQNGMLVVESGSEKGYEVAFEPNIDYTPAELSRLLISVETDVRFDIEFLVTTADGDRIFSLRDDFYPLLCTAPDGDYIPAMTGSAGLDFYGCYTYNKIVPADGISTIKKVTIRVGGIGKVYVNDLQMAANDVITLFTDSVVKTDSSLEIVTGDVDRDLAITSSDARVELLYLLGLETFTEDQITAGDYNGDGVITTTDVRLILVQIAA